MAAGNAHEPRRNHPRTALHNFMFGDPPAGVESPVDHRLVGDREQPSFVQPPIGHEKAVGIQIDADGDPSRLRRRVQSRRRRVSHEVLDFVPVVTLDASDHSLLNRHAASGEDSDEEETLRLRAKKFDRQPLRSWIEDDHEGACNLRPETDRGEDGDGLPPGIEGEERVAMKVCVGQVAEFPGSLAAPPEAMALPQPLVGQEIEDHHLAGHGVDDQHR